MIGPSRLASRPGRAGAVTTQGNTLKTWGLLELCNSIVGPAVVLLLSLFVG